MKKLFLIIMLNLIYVLSYCQKMSNLKVEIGFVKRNETFDLTKFGEARKIIYQPLDPNSSTGIISSVGLEREDYINSLLLGLSRKLPGRNNLYITFNNTISINKQISLSKQINSVNNIYAKRFKRSHFIEVSSNLYLNKSKTFSLILGVGVGLLNCGTNFLIKPKELEPIVKSSIYGTERKPASKFQIGIEKYPIRFSTNAYFMGRDNINNPQLMLEWKFSYLISPFAKKGHVFELPKFKILQKKK